MARLPALMAAPLLVLALAACDPVGGGTVETYPPARPPLPWQHVTSPAVRYIPPQVRGDNEPEPTPPPRPVFRPGPAPAPTPSPVVVLGPCLPLYGPGTPVPVNVTTLPGPTVLTWFHNGDPATSAYWVGVESLSGAKSIRWTKVTPPVGCQDVSFTVPGLTVKKPYLLWLDADSLTPETGSGTTRHTLTSVAVTPA